MIRSEAIVILNRMRNYYGIRQDGEEYAQAIDIAINAFCENDKLKNRCAVLSECKLCMFCHYSCEYRNDTYRGEELGGDERRL